MLLVGVQLVWSYRPPSTTKIGCDVPEILVIILSYNCRDDTCECLGSLIKHSCPGMGILVIDNASTDGAPALIRQRFPEVELITMAENSGWSGGNNTGIKIALERGYRSVCLLNSDTVVTANAISSLARVAAENQPCLLHPAIYYYDEPEVPQLDPSARDEPGQLEARPISESLFALSHAFGACLVVSAEVFRKVGLLDERLFLMGEDEDIYRRALKYGYPSLCTIEARIYHKASRSFGNVRTPVKTYYSVRNTLLVGGKHARNFWDYVRLLKSLYWSLYYFAAIPTEKKNRSALFIIWAVSRDPFARATRLAIRDLLLRRFGRIREIDARRLTGADRPVASGEAAPSN